MAAASTYLANKLLDHALDVESFDMPSVYVALNTADPTDAGLVGTETSGGSYERQSASFDSAADGTTQNQDLVLFESLDAEVITHISIWDADTDGNMLFFGQLVSPITVTVGDSLAFAAGDIDLTMF